jgi:outer membrane protein assembly factor BamB
VTRSGFSVFLLTVSFFGVRSFALDQPQWGEAWTRNMVSPEKNLPDSFDPKTGRSVKWRARLGTQTHSTPVIARGRVYIGTNNDEPRDPKHHGDRGVLMCLDEKDGHLLWQLVVPKREEDAYMDWPRMGIASDAAVEGDRVYLVDNRGAVLCLDAKGMTDGNDGPFRDEAAYLTPASANGVARQEAGAETQPESLRPPSDGKLINPGPLDADILWKFDLVGECGIWPHDAAHSSILIHGDLLYLNTANGVDNTHKRIRAPNAPSLVAIDKNTGRLIARDDEHIAQDVFHNTWAGPSMGVVNGRELLFFCAGNGIVYAFEPVRNFTDSPASSSGAGGLQQKAGEVSTLKKVFQFDFDPSAPKTDIHRYIGNRHESPSNLYGMPVILNDRLYVAGGGDIWWGKTEAWLKCIAPSGTGNISKQGLVWSLPLEKHVLSTPAVYKEMVFIADCGRSFYCVEASTGKPLWKHGIEGEVWASAYVADDKVYLGTRSGKFYVFAASREGKLLTELDFGAPISATTTAANGVLYVATMTDLFALQTSPREK